ncbi:MAG: ATP phosphoribosyltransferase regulatory subunit, partial [Pseudomonadota bacterium]|nr:ATP phosphoribosyltransferase regulatory subunit [Pseudomonadota bacterium]
MTTIPPGLLPEGLSDRLPPQAQASARLVRRVLDTVATHGYERVMPPLAEFEDTLTQRLTSMRAQDLVRVVDPVSQRTLAFRPDMTAQVGRIAATRLAAAPRPLRLSSAGPVIRQKATQLRPEREKMQLGAELIGSDSVPAAVEIVNIAIEALQAAGVTGITIDFTLPDLVDMLAAGPLPLGGAQVEAVRAELDAKDAGA